MYCSSSVKMDAIGRLLLLGLFCGFASADITFEKQCLTHNDLNQALAPIRAEYNKQLQEAKATFKAEVDSITTSFHQELQDIKTDLKEQKQINNRNNLQMGELQESIARLEEEKDQFAEETAKLHNDVARLEVEKTQLADKIVELQNVIAGPAEERTQFAEETADLQNDVVRLEGERTQPAEDMNKEIEHGEKRNGGEPSAVQEKKDKTDISGGKRYFEDKRHLKRQATETRVAFSVKLDGHSVGENLGAQQTIHFDGIVSNLGNAYNAHFGAFTAPVSGWYVFSLSMTSRPHETQALDVVNGGSLLFHCYCTGDEFNSASRTMVIHLNQGNDVWVRTTSLGYSPNVHGNGFTSFTGWLLYSD